MLQTHPTPQLPQKGWPVWVLSAVAPVVLALGFVGGMAIATYGPHGSQTVDTAQAGSAAATNGPAKTPQQANAPSPTTPFTPSAGDFQRGGDPADGTLPMPGPHGGSSQSPSNTNAADPPPKDIREARQELVRSYSRLQIGNYTIASFDYQQMRNAGTSISLVGMIGVNDYAAWSAAQREDPDGLRSWLESAARRVQAAAARDHFWLSWAVVEVLPGRPSGYADFELTPLADGSYLVVRPLAATAEPTNTTVSLRAPVGESPDADRALLGTSAWATYSPAIRFDSTDLYRPAGLAGKRPQ